MLDDVHYSPKSDAKVVPEAFYPLARLLVLVNLGAKLGPRLVMHLFILSYIAGNVSAYIVDMAVK